MRQWVFCLMGCLNYNSKMQFTHFKHEIIMDCTLITDPDIKMADLGKEWIFGLVKIELK